MKASALSALLAELPDLPATIVARWIPAEIALGACDLEIYEVTRARANTCLFVHPLLHAKIYRFDDHALLGSANLTRKALGWAAPANLEVLVDAGTSLAELRAFEQELLASALEVDEAYRDTVAQQVKVLAHQVAAETFTHEVARTWLPSCNAPHRLWNVYADYETWRLVESARQAAAADLAALAVPAGLEREQFRKHVAAVLGCIPLVQEIDRAAGQGLTTNSASALIIAAAKSEPLPYAPAETWEVLQAWLMHFFRTAIGASQSPRCFRHGRVIG
jgi:hypothetical protein